MTPKTGLRLSRTSMVLCVIAVVCHFLAFAFIEPDHARLLSFLGWALNAVGLGISLVSFYGAIRSRRQFEKEFLQKMALQDARFAKILEESKALGRQKF